MSGEVFSDDEERILLAHGEGGRLMRRLIRQRIVAALDHGGVLGQLEDAARLPHFSGRLAVTTDSFVVTPLFFPGGDIGKLAVHGTVNDLAVSGARARYLTLGFILEEGLALSVLDRVLASIAEAARDTETQIVAGDTKVVPRGAADGLFVTMTGIGELIEPMLSGPAALQPGDQLLVSGPIGRHGVAVLCAREQLEFQPAPASDSAPLATVCHQLQRSLGANLRAMRDATRGGLAAVCHEWAEACGKSLVLFEDAIPVSSDVRGVCELLGLDPVHIANEGTMLLGVAADAVDEALAVMHAFPQTAQACHIGQVSERDRLPVMVRTRMGRTRPLDDPLGSPLPRIC
ncbi:MAG: hydrogenase expression/formation protein HypE [Pirellulaceae bacterium]|nr:MAG: hydrogenase expression/formation protein HypE [Pirellulaceae bacterium]